ncbi:MULTISPECIES: hypothetical protein [Trichocoleus]|uniref:hypothetical protein n=1 Tax=Trichocoleus TaxID=450526 RepID=UPI001683D259|nr:hypothetical protein [Trichocoleus sp. FACHB-262]MBD2119837.1 hypothetical protein [Trichocoleus sp. FACHB-262]
METKTKKPQTPPDEAVVDRNVEKIGFESWAAQVRQQMLASLRKRGVNPDEIE